MNMYVICLKQGKGRTMDWLWRLFIVSISFLAGWICGHMRAVEKIDKVLDEEDAKDQAQDKKVEEQKFVTQVPVNDLVTVDTEALLQAHPNTALTEEQLGTIANFLGAVSWHAGIATEYGMIDTYVNNAVPKVIGELRGDDMDSTAARVVSLKIGVYRVIELMQLDNRAWVHALTEKEKDYYRRYTQYAKSG